MFDKIRTSYGLVQESWAVVRQDREILLFPVIGGILSLVIGLTFLLPVVVTSNGSRDLSAAALVVLFLYYVVLYTAQIFCGVATMCCAAIRMDGGDPTVGDGLRGAGAHLPAIVGWALVSATVGLVVRIIEGRSELAGRFIAAIVGVAWTTLTYFVVPVMIFEGKGVPSAVGRSVQLFKATWGEQVVGDAGIGLFFMLLGVLGVAPLALGLVLIGGPLTVVGVLLLVLTVAYWVGLGVVSTALSAVFNLALYRYAAQGTAPAGFSSQLVADHWRAR